MTAPAVAPGDMTSVRRPNSRAAPWRMDFLSVLMDSSRMGRAGAVVAVLAATTFLASCSTSVTQPTEALTTITTGTSIGVSAETTSTFVADAVPAVNAAADQGCVGEAGTLQARAADWYPDRTDGSLGLNGERSESAELEVFVSAATDAIAAVAPRFTLSDQFEYRRMSGGCATHRYAIYANADEQIIVSTWRVESAADPFSVPNESPFTEIDDSTMASRGAHLAIVLAVAPDGTTSRVSAYGARASDLVAGWPTTTGPLPSAEPPGLTPITADALVPVAHEMLTVVLSRR
jgi:hypothetical protein